MSHVNYTALRSLRSGVSSGTEIDYDFDVSVLDRETKPVRKDQVSLGGVQETLRERTDIIFTLRTSPMTDTDFEHVRQFLDSVDGGEQFTLDPYGTQASPVDPQTCVLISTGYKESRVSQNYFSATFKARVV